MTDTDFDSFEELDLYEEDNPFDSAFDLINNDISDSKIFNPHNKALRQGGFSSLDETYQKAKIEVLNKYNYYYKKILLPNISKKYGIKIG